MNRKQIFAIFLGLAAGLFLLAAPVLAVDCPTDNGSGVGCLDPGSPYYCGGACRSSQTQCVGGWTPSPICASGFACANFQTADACGYGATCASGYTRCGSWPSYTCTATIAPVSPCNAYNTCSNYCTGCITGYTICPSTHVCVANLTCQPGQTFNPCTNACEGAVSMLKLGYDSVSGTNIIQSAGYPTLYIPASQNVGIGTSVPGAKLEVDATSGYAILAGASTSTAYRIGNISTPIDDFDAATKAYVDSVAPGGTLSLWNGTQDGNIWNGTNGAGNVGIGTTNPGYKLTVAGNGIFYNQLVVSHATSYGQLQILSNSNTNWEGSRIEFNRARGTSSAKLAVASSDTIGWFDYFAWDGAASRRVGQFNMIVDGAVSSGIVPGKFSIYTANSSGVNTLRFTAYANDNIAMATSGGKVGIGTTNPDEKLTIVTPSASGEQTALSLRHPLIVANTNVAIKFWPAGGYSGMTLPGKIVATAPSGNNIGFNFVTNNSGTANTAVSILPTGNVGIGTTAPGARLEVDATTGYAILAGSSTSTAYRIGNVSTPIEDFDAATKAYVDSVAPGGALSLWNGTQDGNIWNGTNGTGNVGIGTTNPSTKLHITSGANQGVLIGSAAATYPAWMGTNGLYVDGAFRASSYLINSGGEILWGAGQARMGGYNPSTGSNTYLSFSTGGIAAYGERMRIIDNGNVGIGTTNPDQLLTLAKSGAQVIRFHDNALNRSADIYSGEGSSLNFRLGYPNYKFYFLNSSSNILMIIDSAGKVGIGTTAPGAKLEVDATSGYAILAGSSTSTAYRIGNVSTPIDDFDAATKAYVDAGIASATSSIATIAHYIGATSAIYNGNNNGTTGYTHAHSLCAAAFTDSHVCATFELLDTIKSGGTMPDQDVWIFNGPPAYTAMANDCNARISVSATEYGTYWQKPGGGYAEGRGLLLTCNNSIRLACCK